MKTTLGGAVVTVAFCATALVTGLSAQQPAKGTPLASLARARCDSAQREADASQRFGVSTGHRGDVALVGVVRDAASTLPLDSAKVFVQWINVSLSRLGIRRELAMRSAQTDHNGVYVLCAVPGGGTLFEWAERDNAATGAMVVKVLDGATRFDLSLDLNARATATADLASDPLADRASQYRPVTVGTERYRAVVQAPGGVPVQFARVRTLDHAYAISNERGLVTLDSVPRGSAMLDVMAIGYLPERRAITVRGSNAPPDTIVMTPLKSVLDTIRVLGGDETGFFRRRTGKTGQFISAADIEHENPASTIGLLRSRDGLRYDLDRDGNPYLKITSGNAGSCRPLVFIDGFPPPPNEHHVTGIPDMNDAIRPDEIGGVEIYLNVAQLPAELRRFIFGPVSCGVIEFWTRERLGMPQMPKPARPSKPREKFAQRSSLQPRGSLLGSVKARVQSSQLAVSSEHEL